MGAFIVPRGPKKQFVPTITLEDISDLLVLYLSSIRDYVHSSAAIECNPEEKRTTMVLQGQIDPRLDRRICVRAIVQGRTAPRFDSKMWADPFTVELVSEDLGLNLELRIEPHADRTIAVSKERGPRMDLAVPAPVDDVSPADDSRTEIADKPAAESADAAPLAAAAQEPAAGNDNVAVTTPEAPQPDPQVETVLEPPPTDETAIVNAGPDAANELVLDTGDRDLQSASEAADVASAAEHESAEPDVDRVVVETPADAVETVAANADRGDGEIAAGTSAEIIRDFESLTGGDGAGEPEIELDAAAEAVFDARPAVVEAPAELAYANLDVVAENAPPPPAPETVVETLTSAGPIVAEAPVDVTFTGLEPLEHRDANPANDDGTATQGSMISAVVSIDVEVTDEREGVAEIAEEAEDAEVRGPRSPEVNDPADDEVNGGALTAPEPVADAEPVGSQIPEVVASEADTQAGTMADEAETIAATEDDDEAAGTSSADEAVAAEKPGEAAATSIGSDPGSERETAELLQAERPITISEVLADEEELIIDLRSGEAAELAGASTMPNEASPAADGHETQTPATSENTSEPEERATSVEDPTVAVPHIENESVDGTSIEPAEAGGGEDELEEETADAGLAGENDDELPVVAEASDEEDEFSSDESHGRVLISHDVITAMTEQAVFGPGQRKRCAIVNGDNSFAFSIVGESHYQNELERIALGHERRRGRFLIPALLVPEPSNFFDKYAVAVQVNRRTVGYLTFEAGPSLLKALAAGGFDCAACGAAISGGEIMNDGTVAAFSVKLDVTEPLVLGETAQSGAPQPSALSTARAA